MLKKLKQALSIISIEITSIISKSKFIAAGTICVFSVTPSYSQGNFEFVIEGQSGLNLVVVGFSNSGSMIFQDIVSEPEKRNSGLSYVVRVDESILKKASLAQWCVFDTTGKWNRLPKGRTQVALCDDRPFESGGSYKFELRTEKSSSIVDAAKAALASKQDGKQIELSGAVVNSPTGVSSGNAEAVNLDGHVASIILNNVNASGRCVQTLLYALGYYDSDIDGLIGSESNIAAKKYIETKPFSSPVKELSPATASSWCNQLIVDNPDLSALIEAELATFLFNGESKILISENRPSNLSYDLKGASSESVFVTLMDIGRKDNGTLTRQNHDRSVIYIINSGVKAGTRIRTTWGFRLNPNEPWFRQEYKYTVSEADPKEPLVLINDVYASNAGEFIFAIYVNGKKFSERSIQVK